MKIIEKPVVQVEKATDLKDIILVIGALMKSLKNIYENSNFYKEARIVSFIDRLLECIISKIKEKININAAVSQGKENNYEEGFKVQVEQAKTIMQKFQEVKLNKGLNLNIEFLCGIADE